MVKELKESTKFVLSVEFWRIGLYWTVALLVSYFQLLLFPKHFKSYPRCSPTSTSSKSISSTVCIITGATSGLGKAAAFALSKEGFFVVLAGRSTTKLAETVAEIKNVNKDAQVKAFQVDVSSLQSLLKFKDSLQQWLLDSNMHSSIQLLINNAGILATLSRCSEEGFDQAMGTNYIGAFSLTKLLLPLLGNSPVASRIVNVTSFTYRSVSSVQVDNDTVSGKCFMRLKGYPCGHVYEYSKLCLLLFSYELHRRLGAMANFHHVSVIAVDPGAVETNIMRELPLCISYLALSVLRLVGLLQSPERGVSAILDASLAPPEVSGLYFFGGKGRAINSSKLSYNPKLGEQLWTTSSALLKAACLETCFSAADTIL
ncbi:uncharacterized protein [Rutidosis leptorrhynchoides]|uniref:uncharacterized protein n=1 Tax=Rutidosis leptorrhynchoides TaxID=125765 RepID=UPI003A9922FB